jgi:uncharacterized HAD superfamily protein
MKTNNIAFDLDGVLIDVMPIIERYLWDLYGQDGITLDNGKFKIETVGKLSNNKIWKAIKLMYKDVDAVMPEFGAIVLLDMLRDHKTKVVTARPEQYRDDTQAVIDRLFPGVSIELCMAPGAQKINHLEGIQFFVEDRRRNACQLAKLGKSVFLVNRPYNWMDKDPEGVIRINGLYELAKQPELFCANIQSQS